MLIERTLEASADPLPARALDFIAAGRSRFKSIDCFDFVPSDYDMAWRCLNALPRGRFCEWGSGFGIVTGLAEMLGFESYGIEVDPPLADASRALLQEFGLRASIETGDYLQSTLRADVYFVYCWPGKLAATEEHFEAIAPISSTLLICWGQSDIRCKVRKQA